MENGLRIIRLGDVQSPSQSYSFEEAFGEYSEARGRGRARRKKRKLERIANRAEVRAARQAARKERQQGRIQKRAEAQAARQAKRTAATEMRAERKGIRKLRRVERQAIGREEEPLMDDQGLDTGVTPEMEAPEAVPSDYDTTNVSQEADYVDEGVSNTGYADTSLEQGGYEPQTQGGYDANYTSAETPLDYGNEDIYPESVGSEGGYAEEGDYSDEGDYIGGGDYLGEYNESDMPFDGVMGAEDRFSEFSDSDIEPEIQDTVNKLVWNKELIKRLENQRNAVGGNRKQGFSRQIIARKKRLNELQSQLDGYCNVEGNYLNADGKMVAGKRRADVARAYGVAMRKRNRIHAPKFTPVAKGLNPQIAPNRIVVPATSSFTGLNGLDLQEDFDAPRVREIMLGADGSTSSKISWTSVAIGVAAGVAAIWVARKYKWIK